MVLIMLILVIFEVRFLVKGIIEFRNSLSDEDIIKPIMEESKQSKMIV